MINILLCIMAGIVVGYLAKKTTVVKYTGSLLNVTIMLLLFFLGLSVGSNEQVVSNFTTIGLDAFLLAVGATLGSLFCAKWVYKKFF
ncbi:MAG: lysine exporter LysO family protein [Porphyromonadaceae bacterium]|nr:lysine exporter LysO family protein [Porphyromonadaceae bacterium]